MTVAWIGFLLLVLACLAIDLGAFGRRHAAGSEMSIGESVRWTLIWIATGLAFAGVVYLMYEHGWGGATLRTVDGVVENDGAEAALLYLTAYVLEKSLSIDNLFVMAIVFRRFQVTQVQQHRVLFYGILGAIVLRGFMIGGGLYLAQRFSWLFYVFGAYLAYTGVKLLVTDDEPAQESESEARPDGWGMRMLRKVVPFTSMPGADHFVVRVDGKLHFTTLLACLLVIEATDVVFAVDSVPAVLAVSIEPFVCYTSNIFAILGLRSLYFVLARMMARFKHLKYSLSLILVFIGGKLFFHHWVAEHVPQRLAIGGSLALIMILLTAGIAWSWRSGRDVARA